MPDAWHKVPKSTTTGAADLAPLFLWYKAEKTARKMTDAGRKNDLITELYVTYGDDIPWYGFDKLSPPTTPEIKNRRQNVYMTFCNGVKRTSLTKHLSVEWVPKQSARPPSHSSPAFLPRRGFRILRVAHLHFSVSRGACRDTIIFLCEGSDILMSTLLAKVLDAERPGLVVFTDDQLNDKGTLWDAKSVLAKFTKVVTQRKIPWALVFGNHDEEDGEAKRDQVQYTQGLPDSLI